MNPNALMKLLKEVAEKEKIKVTDDVLDKIIECSLSSARLALVLLHKIAGVEGEDAQIDAIEKGTPNKQGIELARALLAKKPWSEVSALIKSIEEEPETIRWIVMGYMSSVMLGGGKMLPRAYNVLRAFQYPFYDTKKNGLVLASYESCTS
jgi:DNA polymerase III delta prime subunit